MRSPGASHLHISESLHLREKTTCCRGRKKPRRRAPRLSFTSSSYTVIDFPAQPCSWEGGLTLPAVNLALLPDFVRRVPWRFGIVGRPSRTPVVVAPCFDVDRPLCVE